jgi:hypothetical protein
MGGITAGLREQIALLAEANARADAAIAAILDLAHQLETADRDGVPVLLEAAQVIGRCEQARHGQLVRVLAQAERVKAHRGGLIPWITTHLDASDGRARAIAQSARWIGDLPHLAEPLSSGRVGADTIRALTRTARTVKGTGLDPAETLAAVLETTARDGVHAAKKQVQVLEETVDPGAAEERLAKQRARSFARSTSTDSGMTRFKVLLDPARATTVQAAIDLQAADIIRRRQYDHTDPAPADIRTTEQINATRSSEWPRSSSTPAPSSAERPSPHPPCTPPYSTAGWSRRSTARCYPALSQHRPDTLPRTCSNTIRMVNRSVMTVSSLMTIRLRGWRVRLSVLRWRGVIGVAPIRAVPGPRRGLCMPITAPRTATADPPPCGISPCTAANTTP